MFMKLFTICSSCKTPIKIKSIASSRPELEHELGEYFTVNCPSCANNSKKHVNDVTARENEYVITIGVIAGVLITICFFFMLGFLGLISFIIPILIWKSQSNAVHTFNKYMLPRTGK